VFSQARFSTGFSWTFGCRQTHQNLHTAVKKIIDATENRQVIAFPGPIPSDEKNAHHSCGGSPGLGLKVRTVFPFDLPRENRQRYDIMKSKV